MTVYLSGLVREYVCRINVLMINEFDLGSLTTSETGVNRRLKRESRKWIAQLTTSLLATFWNCTRVDEVIIISSAPSKP